ncbi:hypothetical protein L914_02661 [Phytophthora nicotianae]|uniref:Uncharacterized protein n=2 Tax=Phytophthora nicotianae TaxID=4792 RepID=V9FUI4_PHYNI|nr:hypothetical protein F443_02770 [Phytophthora nicotianae P1569]ETM53899.1 hypothetical protein L914_02661 [Phytophthora nicotianae]
MQALLVKDAMKATLNAKIVVELIVELYTSTRNEESNFTLVADFWTCKTTGDKFVGLRVYLVDKAWQFKSVLLGTIKFNPAYGDREGGILGPFKAWLEHMFKDFGLKKCIFFGVTIAGRKGDAAHGVRLALGVVLRPHGSCGYESIVWCEWYSER